MTHNIGAPNSVARYLSNNSFGENKWLVLEYVKGEYVLHAAQTTYNGAMRYMQTNRILVDIANCLIVQPPKATDVAKRQWLACGLCYGRGKQTSYEDTWDCPICDGQGGSYV